MFESKRKRKQKIDLEKHNVDAFYIKPNRVVHIYRVFQEKK